MPLPRADLDKIRAVLQQAEASLRDYEADAQKARAADLDTSALDSRARALALKISQIKQAFGL